MDRPYRLTFLALACGLLAALATLALPTRAAAATADAAPLREVPVDLSLVPPLDLNGEGRVLNHLSLGLAVSRSTALRGFSLTPVHLVAEDVTGVQVTWAAASAGGLVRGVQLTSLVNVAGDLRGAQLAQVVNVTRGTARGVQLGGVVNVARDLAGLQLAVVNVGGDVGGAQVGVVNVARRVRGAQVGVLNLAGDADASVGVLSLVRNGRHALELHATELSPLGATLRLGGRRVHGLLTVGVTPGEHRETGKTRWTTGAGVGVGFAPAERLGLDLDLLAQALHDDGTSADAGIGSLRVVAAWRASPWLAVFAGPTANVLVTREDRPDLHLGWKLRSGATEVRAWPGFVAGVRL